ncbi:uncharacterized protein CLBA1 isoform X1 [Equus asinus]|uniref:uncharacterized protein CLBA1 isoform X1 n=1 Tax=Equus asinus TaxID=9793 RepID=UPI00071A6BE0
MQGQPELGGVPGQVLPPSGSLSDLAEGAGEVSLHQASKDSGAGETPGAQSGDDVEWVRTRSQLPPTDGDAGIPGRSEGFTTCTTSGPDPGEHSGAWGEFEGFRESSAKSEQFSQSFGLPERPTEPLLPRTPSAQKERGSRQPHRGGPRVTGTATVPPSEPIFNYENIFRFAFQEVPVQQTTEDVSTLDLFLEISSEEKPGLGSVHKLCSESRKLWRALQNTDTTLTSQCLWSESRCQENFFLVLGIDAAQKAPARGQANKHPSVPGPQPEVKEVPQQNASLSGGQGHTAEGPDLKEPGDPSAHSFRLHRCRALIQTKLSGTPGGRQGSLITYSLFLKTPFHGNTQHITFPRKKKMFPPRNLKMMLFNSNVC